jgi:hypothetical protein
MAEFMPVADLGRVTTQAQFPRTRRGLRVLAFADSRIG